MTGTAGSGCLTSWASGAPLSFKTLNTTHRAKPMGRARTPRAIVRWEPRSKDAKLNLFVGVSDIKPVKGMLRHTLDDRIKPGLFYDRPLMVTRNPITPDSKACRTRPSRAKLSGQTSRFASCGNQPLRNVKRKEDWRKKWLGTNDAH